VLLYGPTGWRFIRSEVPLKGGGWVVRCNAKDLSLKRFLTALRGRAKWSC
jgi:hypothetical protein